MNRNDEIENPMVREPQPLPGKREEREYHADDDARYGAPTMKASAPFDPVTHREQLMSAMAEYMACAQALLEEGESIKGGESFVIQRIHQRTVGLAVRVGQLAHRLLPLVQAAREDEAARDRAVGIKPRPVPESVQRWREDVVATTEARVLPLVMGYANGGER